MYEGVQFLGSGHALGSDVVSNREVARSLDLGDDWLIRRTGIAERRVCAEGETSITLAADAIRHAVKNAGLSLTELGQETLLLHVQNGPVAFTPPPGSLICAELGLGTRVLGLDGACAEPLVALDVAAQYLTTGRCERVILSATADFLSMINPSDPTTVGLFGSGAGAIVLRRSTEHVHSLIRGLHWESHSDHVNLGKAMARATRKADDGFTMDYDYYTMDGQGLARLALSVLPPVVQRVLEEAGWEHSDVELVLAHQPNVRMLELGAKRLGFDLGIVPMPARELGNLGAASMLVNLALAEEEAKLASGSKVLMLGFGLGFTCAAAAVEF